MKDRPAMTDTACRKCGAPAPEESGLTAYRCDCEHWNDLKLPKANQDNRPRVALWCVSCGKISKKNPVDVIDHGDGTITVPKSYRVVQPKVDKYESYHATHQEAVIHILAEAQRDVNRADAELTNARRRLRSAQLRFQNAVVAGPQT